MAIEENINSDTFSFEKEAPTLFKLKSEASGFKTPKGYFNSLEDAVIQKLQQPQFDIPEGYFETVEDKVFAKINSEKEVKVISLRKRISKRMIPLVAAASVTLLLVLNVFNSSKNQDVFATLDTSQIESWIEDGSLDVSSEDIAAVYLEDEIETIDLFSDYSDDDYINYLDNVDVESLLLTN